MFLRHNASATLLSITPIPLTRLSRQPWTASARSVRAVSSTGVVPHTAIQVYSSWTRISTAILPSSGWDCIENLTQSLLSHIMNFCSSTKWRSMTRNLARIWSLVYSNTALLSSRAAILQPHLAINGHWSKIRPCLLFRIMRGTTPSSSPPPVHQ